MSEKDCLFYIEDGKYFMTWKGVDYALQSILNKVRPFKYVVGIERGGLILALMISQLLDIPWGVYSPKTGYIDSSTPMGDEDILLVDDIEDSSKTLEEFKERYCRVENIAVLVSRESSKNIALVKGLVVNHNMWIVFPWEVGLGRMKKEGKDYEKM